MPETDGNCVNVCCTFCTVPFFFKQCTMKRDEDTSHVLYIRRKVFTRPAEDQTRLKPPDFIVRDIVPIYIYIYSM
jgi:hypothetical protein